MKIILFLMLVFSLQVTVKAEDPVEITYKVAKKLVKSAKISVSAKKSLKHSVRDAWELHMEAGKENKAKAVKILSSARKFINAGKNGIPKKERKALSRGLLDFGKTIEGEPPVGFAILNIRALDGPKGPALGNGQVLVDGISRGFTGADGDLKLIVRPGTRMVQVRKYPSVMGKTSVTLKKNQTGKIKITAVDGKEFSEPAELGLDQAPDGVLESTFSELRLRVTRPNGTTVPLKDIDLVSLLDPEGGAPTNLTGMTARDPDGTIRFKDPDAIRSILVGMLGRISINVHAEDAHARIYDETTEFFIGAYRVEGKLIAPPSKPGLAVGGIEVIGRILNTDLVFTSESSANGSFSFPLLPSGNLEFESETKVNGVFYYGQGVVVLNDNKKLTVNMLSAEDLANDVVPFTVEVLAPNSGSAPKAAIGPEQGNSDREHRERENLAAASRARAAPPQPAGTGSVTATATADSQNVAVNDTQQLTLKKGTKAVQLSYVVSTAEYPEYVLAQSIFNDTWRIMVLGGSSGKQLLGLTRQINTQLSVAPVWQGDGSTGIIKRVFDVSDLTADGPAEITIFVSATNVGDSLLATTVNATLGADPGVQINKLTGDSSGPLNFHSIPRPGKLNHFDRVFTLDITKPNGSTVKKVTATLVAGALETKLVSAAPNGNTVVEVNEKTIKVNTAFKNTAVQISNPAPPFHVFKIRFKLEVDVGGTTVSDEKETGERLALWRMPDGFDRYSTRDEGGDDWASKGAFDWLKANKALITKINDVSGEHGRNIGHQTHKHGTDIDMFHFHTFSGAVSGGQNYEKLQKAVLLAASTGTGAAAAKSQVVAWISATRTGIDNLATKPEVIELRYIKGSPVTGKLNSGWGRDLLKTGKTKVNGQEFVFTTVVWDESKYISVNDHNDHFHITLSRPLLGE